MFAVIYSFKIHPGRAEAFLESWQALTKLICRHENSLGSRLHKLTDNIYIAYAQWPKKELWKNSGSQLPESANKWKKQMRACCIEINTLYELEMVKDLLTKL